MKQYLREVILEALSSLGIYATSEIAFEQPRQADHGDLTTNIAMVLAKAQKKNPRQLATDIIGAIKIDAALVDKIDVAGPGFINLTFTPKFYQEQLRILLQNESTFGRSNTGAGKKTQVEFVSANPTGPLTVGHGRGAVFGDTVSNLLEWTGHDVTREYYFNNAGRQMRLLGDSVRLRYLEFLGEPVEFPDDYYQGSYIRDIAKHLVDTFGDTLKSEPAEGAFKARAEEDIFIDIKRTLKSLGVEFKTFFNERSLYDEGKITEVVEELRKKNLVYEHEGALWFKTSELGGEKDKVIIKSSGEPTYRLPDIAYHVDKCRRGYDLMVDIFGSDHIATYPDVLAAVKALGFDDTKVKVLIHQFVTIVQDGEIVKMSTRKANFTTLDELIEEVGADVVRYFFLMRSMSSHLNFDINLAKKHSDENPVYYLQYAHARICSVLKYAAEEGRTIGMSAEVALLEKPEELSLIKTLLQFPELVESSSQNFELHHLAEYLHDVAGAFHKFYHHHRVVTEDLPLTAARLALCNAAKAVLRNGFTVLGISSPEQM